MKLLITGKSIKYLEDNLNKYFYSSTYELIEGKVMYMREGKLIENINLKYIKKGNKHQIYKV